MTEIEETADLLPSRGKQRAFRCGYCQTGNHEDCARTIRNGKVNHADRLSTCQCDSPNCPARDPRCMDCKNVRADEINPYTMLCEDRDACIATLAVKRAHNPSLQHIIEIKEKVKMADKTENKKAPRQKAEPKVGKCLVTGKPTKGGNFLPGMDARYVSELVADVLAKKSTEAQAKTKIQNETGSDKLIAKFDKSYGIAKEKATKKAEAAKDKKDAKKAGEVAASSAAKAKAKGKLKAKSS